MEPYVRNFSTEVFAKINVCHEPQKLVSLLKLPKKHQGTMAANLANRMPTITYSQHEKCHVNT